MTPPKEPTDRPMDIADRIYAALQGNERAWLFEAPRARVMAVLRAHVSSETAGLREELRKAGLDLSAASTALVASQARVGRLERALKDQTDAVGSLMQEVLSTCGMFVCEFPQYIEAKKTFTAAKSALAPDAEGRGL